MAADEEPKPLTLGELLSQMEDAQLMANLSVDYGFLPIKAKDVHGQPYTVLAVGADEQTGHITFIIEEAW